MKEQPLSARIKDRFLRFAEDMAEKDFEMGGKAEFLAAFRAYVEKKQLKVDWEAIKGAPDDHLLVSLAMLSPFSPSPLLPCSLETASVSSVSGGAGWPSQGHAT